MPPAQQEISLQHRAKSDLPQGHEQFKDVPSIPAAGIFATSDVRFLKLLARASSQRTAVPGEVFITAGDHNDTAFILLQGDVEVVTDNMSGRGHSSRVLSGPNIFGEDCILKFRQASLTTVRAQTACHIRTLSGNSFKVLLRRFPEERHFFRLHAKSRLEELGVNNSDQGYSVNASSGRSPYAANSMEALTAALGNAPGTVSTASPKQRCSPSSAASSSDHSIGSQGPDALTDVIQSAIYSAGISCGNGGRRGTPTDEPEKGSEVSAHDVALSNARVSAALLRERLLGKEEFGPPPSLGCKMLATTLPTLDFEPVCNRGGRPWRSKAGEQASNVSQQQVAPPQATSGSAGGFTSKGSGIFGLENSAGCVLSSQAGSGHKARALQPSLAAAYSARLARANCSRPATGAGSSLADWSAATSERSMDLVLSEKSMQLCLSTQASTHTLFSMGQKSEEQPQASNVDWRRGHRNHNRGKAANSVGGTSAPSRSPDTQLPLSRSSLGASPEGFADPPPPPPLQPSQPPPPPPPEGGCNERRLVPFTLKGEDFFWQGSATRPAYTPSQQQSSTAQTRSTSRDSSTGSLLQALSPTTNLFPPQPPLPGSGQAELGRCQPASLQCDHSPAEDSPQNSPRGEPQPAWSFSPRSRSSSIENSGDDRPEDEGRARGVLLMGGLAAHNRSHTSSAQSLSVQSVNEGVFTPSAPSSPRLRGIPQVRLRGSRPITPIGDGTSLPLLREGWQVSLCQNVMMWCPSALPSKDAFTQKKVPRPVSPEGSKAKSPRPDPSTLNISLVACANSQEAASFEPISPKGSPLRRRPRRVVQSPEGLGGAQVAAVQASSATALPKAASRENSPAASSAAAIEEDGISPTAARWAAEIPKLRIAPPIGPPPGAPPPPAPAPSGLQNPNDAFDQLLLHRLSTLTPRTSPTPSARPSDSSPRKEMHCASPRPLLSSTAADAHGRIR